jgi:RNA polymerase sigma-70 factor, ECF subfamily
VHLTDGQITSLVERIRVGQQEAFQEFFYTFQPQVFRFLYRYTRDVAIAEDLTQETFINFWEARERLDPTLAAKHYLFRIARNLALQCLARRMHTVPQMLVSNDILVALSQNPQEAYEHSFAADEVHRSLHFLPERCRAVFILSRYDDMSYQEVAQTLQISLQTVKNQMNKALAILRRQLTDRCD